MKTLNIKDLARTDELDGKAMTAVRGGWNMNAPSYKVGNVDYSPSYDSSIHATQNLAQMQGVTNAVANGSAFLDCVSATNTTSQTGQNNIVG